jgi:hypothetical protein
MPYRLNPNDKTQVQIKRNNKWVMLKGGKHKTKKEAKAHLTALNINVHKKK